jgi:S-formylglutathione hydrolase FrmB
MPQTISTFLVPSAVLGREQPVSVLPPDNLHADGSCNTLYLLHGAGGDHLSWPKNALIADLFAGLPIAVIMPSADNAYYLDSEVAPMETFLCNELAPYIDRSFPTIASATARGVTGLSMGGYGALLLALRRPDLFGSAASHSGAVLTARATTEVGLKWELADRLYGVGAEGERKRREHDILSLAQGFVDVDPTTATSRYRGPALYFDCGVDDFLFYASRTVTQTLRMLGIPYEYHEWPGDQNWDYWRAHISDSLRFHRERFAGPPVSA